MIAGKVWGSTELLLKTPIVEMHLMKIKPNSHCSLHAHQYKINAFLVLRGSMTVEVHKNDYDLIDHTTLTEGQVMEVLPNEFHRFVTSDVACVCVEIYYPEVLSTDIIRKDVGGTI